MLGSRMPRKYCWYAVSSRGTQSPAGALTGGPPRYCSDCRAAASSSALNLNPLTKTSLVVGLYSRVGPVGAAISGSVNCVPRTIRSAWTAMSASEGDSPPRPTPDVGVQGAYGSGMAETPMRPRAGLAKGSGVVAMRSPGQRMDETH